MSELIQYHIDEMIKLFGDQLPNPEHYPIQFSYFVKLYKYYNARNPNSNSLTPIT